MDSNLRGFVKRIFFVTGLKEMLLKNKKRKYVVCQKNAKIDAKTLFEGCNSVGKDSSVKDSYIGENSYISYNSDISKIKIGRYASIGPYFANLAGSHPTSKAVSTHPVFFSTKKQIGKTYVDNDKFEELKFVDEDRKYIVK